MARPRGGRSGPDDFRAYYDIFAMLLKAAVEQPAKLTGEHGEVLRDVGDAFMDDAATTTSTMEGTVKVLEVSSDFFELMNGKLNMLKTNVSILEYDKLGKLKRKCPDGVQWRSDSTYRQ